MSNELYIILSFACFKYYINIYKKKTRVMKLKNYSRNVALFSFHFLWIICIQKHEH